MTSSGRDDRSPDEICDAMSRVRREVRDDAATVRESVDTLLDWRYYWNRHPYACAAAAVVLGYVVVPKVVKAKKFAIDVPELIRELKAHGYEPISSDGSPTTVTNSPGMLKGLIGLAMPFVFRAGMNMATGYVQNRSAPSSAAADEAPGVEEYDPYVG